MPPSESTQNDPKDTERLDWLAKQKYGCWGITHELRGWVTQIETGGSAYQGFSFREAIDVAMKASVR